VADLALRRPSLDDVFLRLTGHTTAAGDEEAARAKERVA
jgi:ABC-2 type transport system ATP-binding protein